MAQKVSKTGNENFTDAEARQRFEAALKGAMSTSSKPLKDKPKVKKAGKKSKKADK
jgi:hypothetical protein